MSGFTSVAGASVVTVICVSTIPAWITHVVVLIQVITSDVAVSVEYGLLLVAGVFMPPVGVIHGWGIWFGWWV